MTRSEMLARVSSAELTEWAAYERVTGRLGDERGDIQAALTAYYVVQALGAKKARLDKMMPRWDRPPQDWRQMKSIAEALTRQYGGEVKTAR